MASDVIFGVWDVAWRYSPVGKAALAFGFFSNRCAQAGKTG